MNRLNIYFINYKNMIHNLSNNQNHYHCVVCNKQYTRKSSLDKHTILCEFKIRTKRDLTIAVEESSDILL